MLEILLCKRFGELLSTEWPERGSANGLGLSRGSAAKSRSSCSAPARMAGEKWNA
jgi:hypothetical protein